MVDSPSISAGWPAEREGSQPGSDSDWPSAARQDAEELAGTFEQGGYRTMILTDDEVAKLHVRHMVGGRSPDVANEQLCRFEFPERPGALMAFLEQLGGRWNISLFHYRNHGAVFGRVLAGFEVPAGQMGGFEEFLDRLGYRYELDIFQGEHLTLAIHDQYAPATEFLGTAKVDRNPAHVTYVVDPSLDHADLSFVADHAYWLSGARTRGSGQGRVDAFSHGSGTGGPVASATQVGAGTLGGGNLGTLAFTRQSKTWGPAPPIAPADRIDLTAQNVSAVTINVKRAGKTIVGYGAPGKGNTLLNYCGIRTDFVDFTVDKNTYKQGKFLPGTHIPIHHPDRIREVRPDYVLILPGNFKDEIMEQMAYIREWGGRFVFPIPEVRVLD